ncbi:MAG TPA: hypothetical protein VJ397_00570, partial [Thermoplasmata archaeon]|nr:hypothetical protein [Thermoplasmata archaeon]
MRTSLVAAIVALLIASTFMVTLPGSVAVGAPVEASTSAVSAGLEPDRQMVSAEVATAPALPDGVSMPSPEPTGSPPGQTPYGDPGSGWIADRFAGSGYAVDIAVAGNGTLWAVTSWYGFFGGNGW